MQIDGNQTNFNVVNPYSAAAEKAVAAQRASATRKKLRKRKGGIKRISIPEVASALGKWTDSSHSEPPVEVAYHSAPSE
jgi:hypothetical protein